MPRACRASPCRTATASCPMPGRTFPTETVTGHVGRGPVPSGDRGRHRPRRQSGRRPRRPGCGCRAPRGIPTARRAGAARGSRAGPAGRPAPDNPDRHQGRAGRAPAARGPAHQVVQQRVRALVDAPDPGRVEDALHRNHDIPPRAAQADRHDGLSGLVGTGPDPPGPHLQAPGRDLVGDARLPRAGHSGAGARPRRAAGGAGSGRAPPPAGRARGNRRPAAAHRSRRASRGRPFAPWRSPPGFGASAASARRGRPVRIRAEDVCARDSTLVSADFAHQSMFFAQLPPAPRRRTGPLPQPSRSRCIDTDCR